MPPLIEGIPLWVAGTNACIASASQERLTNPFILELLS